MTTWGIVATIKAPVDETLNFAAYHLSLGADQIFVYLDDANPDAFEALSSHPRVTPIATDDAFWMKRGRRPVKHQVRQSRNATQCYRRKANVDWLIHMDVDEFLVPSISIHEVLYGLPDDVMCARVRPIEQLAGAPTLFKAFVPSGARRHRPVEEIYPTFGRHLRSGFLSHLAGKIFVRSGHADMSIRIHQAQIGDIPVKDIELEQIDLAHAHAKSWDAFLAAYRFRLTEGCYRADLAPERPRDEGGITLHDLFTKLEAERGEEGLRAFFDEVCAATPRLTDALDQHGLLRRVDLDLETHVRAHFPQYV